MKILRRDRSGDLKDANSPYRTERLAYWTWQCLRHPLTVPAFLIRHTEISFGPDDVRPLWIYGGPQYELPLYTGVDIQNVTLYGDSTALRHLANELNDRADHYDRIAAMYAAGQPVTREDRATADWFHVPNAN